MNYKDYELINEKRNRAYKHLQVKIVWIKLNNSKKKKNMKMKIDVTQRKIQKIKDR